MPSTPLTLTLPQFPSSPLHLSLYTNVTNAPTIRSQLLSGNTAYSYAFLDPSTILSISHVLAAVYRALTEREAGTMRTRTVNSEIVFSMAPSMNIGDALKRFGVKDESTALFVVKVADEAEDVVGAEEVGVALESIVEGESVALCDDALQALTDIEVVRKNYKIPQGVVLNDRIAAAQIVTGAIALRGYS
ncbi:kinase binding protein CGI-121-domain-containing protein [Myxozyma melibiosi]|uniref:EKC/KEOPS complex subunit CGI121 n=1 Tax=Myxozyma melibiosi TaxID=54550 RepID=A0ABR1F394_9ASCO